MEFEKKEHLAKIASPVRDVMFIAKQITIGKVP
jgi:hypothetical protein